MELKIAIDERQAAGLQRELDWYNAANFEAPLSAEEYVVVQWVTPNLNRLANHYDAATTTDITILRNAIKADPQAAKDAIEAAETAVVRAQK